MANLIKCFSASIPEATEKFCAAAERCGASHELFANPLPGPSGETLHAAAALVGSRAAKRVLLVISGEHGVEGYGGAGIQTALLDQGIAPPEDAAVLMIHHINPWGAAWNVRENEDNVDLFRNFTYALKPSQVDPLYAELDEAVNLRALEGSQRVKADHALEVLIHEHGQDRLLWALRRGQYDYPNGMTYHGRGPTWSKLVLDRMIRKLIPECTELVVLDIHSGVPGNGEIMSVCYEPPDSANGQKLQRLLGNVYFAGQDPSIPAHNDPYPWTFVDDLLPEVSLLFVPVELCSDRHSLSFEQLREHHYFHTYGDMNSERAREDGRVFRRSYYVEEDAWKQKVAQGGIALFHKLLHELTSKKSFVES
jgi:polar amino acid transport system ATP-binding protein